MLVVDVGVQTEVGVWQYIAAQYSNTHIITHKQKIINKKKNLQKRTMWTSLKNYASNPKGAGDATNKSDVLPFSITFSLGDQKDLLQVNTRSSTTSTSKSRNKEKEAAARRKLMLALTEDPACFRFMQAELRQRGIKTHMATQQVLRNDAKLLKTLSDYVMSKGVTLNKQIQVQNHIIGGGGVGMGMGMGMGGIHSKRNFNNTGSNLLHNIKGLITQQEEDQELSMRAPAPKYVVVSAPPSMRDSNSHNSGNKTGSDFLSVAPTAKARKRGSFLHMMTGTGANHNRKHQSQRVFGHPRLMGSTTTTTTSCTSFTRSTSTARSSIEAQKTLASAAEWLSLRNVLRNNVSDSVVPDRASWLSTSRAGNKHQRQHPQINMSSREMSERLKNSLQSLNASTIDNTTSVRSNSSAAAKEFYESYNRSSGNAKFLYVEFPSLEDKSHQQETHSQSPRADKSKTKRISLKAALRRSRASPECEVKTNQMEPMDMEQAQQLASRL
jgi:hypothetical protein